MKTKKLWGVVLMMVMLLAFTYTVQAAFPDVTSEDWFYDAAEWAYDNGIIKGYDDGSFGGNDNLTRGQFVTILYRLQNSPQCEFESGVYGDVEDGWFYSVPVTWAQQNGVMSGYENGNFGPADNITREQVATILYRYTKNVLNLDPSFSGDANNAAYYPDGSAVSTFAKEGVQFALSASLITGDQGYINPIGNANRAQIAIILQRYCSFIEQRNGNAEVPSILNLDSMYTIEADVKLTGTGTGYHAKLVACTPTSATSFGIQFDQWGEPPYTGKTTFLIENVLNNDVGGQTYTRTGYGALDTTYHLMFTVSENGRCDTYVNGVKTGSVVNPGLANQNIYLRVEGAGRKNGDSVQAEFSNISIKGSGQYNPEKIWGTHNFDTNEGIHSDASDFVNKKVTISGSVVGLTEEQDWDNAYGIVSGIIQFVE